MNNNYSLMTKTLNLLKEDIGASRLGDYKKNFLVGLIDILVYCMDQVYIMLPAKIDD